MEIRDPIHGMIEYDEIEEKIINSSPFQRLRNIKQLALAHYLYPGAHHSRFEHSLGVMEVASKMYDRLFKKQGAELKSSCFKIFSRSIIRKAALFHDIGHGPFSHVSEAIFSNITGKLKLEKITGKKDEEAHEFLSYRIVEEFYKDILSPEEIDQIKQIIQKKAISNALTEIISGPLDADKLDYLLRDSYYSGVKYGIFDLDRVLNTLYILSSGEGTTLGIKEEGIHAIEQYVMCKYFITNQVYGHINRQITDQMLIRCVLLAEKEGNITIKELFTLVDSKNYFDTFLSYDDYSLIDTILKDTRNGFAKKYALRIKNRKLFKYSKSIDISSSIKNDDEIQKAIEILSNDYKKERIEEKLSEVFNIPKEEIIVHYLHPKDPFLKIYSMSYDNLRDKIMVLTKENDRKQFSKVSDIEIKFKEKLLGKLFIFLPEKKSEFPIDENRIIEIILS